MAYRVPRLLLLLTLLLPLPAFAAGFHPPASEAERALDATIKRAQTDAAMKGYLLRAPATYGVLGDEYGKLYTKGLMNAWSETEANLVYQQCGGDYQTGRHCGIEYNPVTCTNFNYENYVYRTDADADPNAAVIAYRLPEGIQIIATYYLVKRDGAWKLDAVDCVVGDKFNL